MRLPWSQIDLRWTPHVPGLAANPTTCAAAGRHRCSRACEEHARYEAGTSPEAGDVSRATARIKSRRTAPARRRHPRPAAQGRVTADERSGQPRSLCPPATCHGLPDRCPSHQRTAFPAARAPGKHRGRRADTRGCTPDSAARVKPEHAADAGPWPSAQSPRPLTPLPPHRRRPLFVRGHRNTALYSATR